MFGWLKRLRGQGVEIVVDSIPLSTIIRWYLYDLDVKDANELAEAFGMIPVSGEVEEKEREDALRRRANISPLMSFLDIFAEINSKAISVVQEIELLAAGLTQAQIAASSEFLKHFYRNLSLSVLASAIASAVEIGLLTVNGSLVSLGDEDE